MANLLLSKEVFRSLKQHHKCKTSPFLSFHNYLFLKPHFIYQPVMKHLWFKCSKLILKRACFIISKIYVSIILINDLSNQEY